MIITLPTFYYSNSSNTGASFILHEKASTYYWSGQSPLSIKCFFSGRALYSLEHGYYAVDDASYLLVNHDQPYTINIESNTPVESFCLFFDPAFVADLYRSLTLPTETLLANPRASSPLTLSFIERTYPHDTLLSPILFSLRNALTFSPSFSTIKLYEVYKELLARLFQLHALVLQEIASLPALRAATRTEVYRRLYRAHEYARAFFDLPLTVPELASIASLSPSHFLRLFKEVFHQTPHQFLIDLRLYRAKELLLKTELPITEICFSVGFESLGSFSWLFAQRCGCSPLAFRQQKK